MQKIPVRQINTANQPVTSGRFRIRTVSSILDGKDLEQDLHRHDFFFILVLQKGKGTHEIDFSPFTIKDNSVFILRPGQVHQLTLKAGSSGFLVEFDSAFYHPADKQAALRLIKAGNKNFCAVEKRRFNKLITVLEQIFLEYTEKQTGYNDAIKAALDIFFIEFNRQSAHTGVSANHSNLYTQERLEEFQDLLEKHIHTKKQVSDYAALLNITPYQLNAITKATLQKTVSALINEHIVLEAKRLLMGTASQVNQVADQMGYDDPSYFIRFFKKQTGYTPEAFRQHFK